MVKGSTTSVSSKPKRVRKTELEKQVARLELEAERKDAAAAAAAVEAGQRTALFLVSSFLGVCVCVVCVVRAFFSAITSSYSED